MAFEQKLREQYQQELAGIRSAGLFKEERYIHAPQGAEIEVEFPVGTGEKPRRVINMCANNYLGLSSHPEVLNAAHEGLKERGYGMSSVRFICGTQDIHRELEVRLTEFLGTEDTLLFPSCMDANAGVFEALLNEQDVMIADRLVHASIVDGMRLCKAMQDTFKHSDMGHLEEKLQEHQDKRIRMIITDGVFSMDGDVAKMDQIVALGERNTARWSAPMNRMPPALWVKRAAAYMNSAESSARWMSSQPRWERRSAALPEAASADAANWWNSAGSAPGRTSFPIHWRRSLLPALSKSWSFSPLPPNGATNSSETRCTGEKE